jgi:hypothetical protein
MFRIVPSIDTLDQHLYQLEHHPELYRPARCPCCGMGDVWCHGYYYRNADREGKDGGYLDPVPIPRYYCPNCERTCSRLPSCIPPRRWYLWAVQQVVLVLLLSGDSIHKATKNGQPRRSTISRWWHWIQDQFTLHGFSLRARFSELGRHASLSSFWLACFRQISLADAMVVLDQDGVAVP